MIYFLDILFKIIQNVVPILGVYIFHFISFKRKGQYFSKCRFREIVDILAIFHSNQCKKTSRFVADFFYVALKMIFQNNTLPRVHLKNKPGYIINTKQAIVMKHH